MKKVEVSEVRAMLKEILAAKSAEHNLIGVVLKLGSGVIEESELKDFGELKEPLQVVVNATQATPGGVISVDEATWRELENIYFHCVTRHLLF